MLNYYDSLKKISTKVLLGFSVIFLASAMVSCVALMEPSEFYCTDDSDCLGGKTCKSKVCRAPSWCEFDFDCEIGMECTEKVCTSIDGWCGSNDDCNPGLKCDVELNECIDEDWCSDQRHCPDHQFCDEPTNTCHNKDWCDQNSDCAAPYSECYLEEDSKKNRCVPPGWCQDKSDCDADEICLNAEDADTENNVCRHPDWCQDSNDCSPNETCKSLGDEERYQRCVPQDWCRNEEDCTLSKPRCIVDVNDTDNNRCVSADWCENDEDCDQYYECDTDEDWTQNKCQEDPNAIGVGQPCSSNADCADYELGKTCAHFHYGETDTCQIYRGDEYSCKSSCPKPFPICVFCYGNTGNNPTGYYCLDSSTLSSVSYCERE